MTSPASAVIVLGSINLDLVARVERLPQPGETVGGAEFATYPGGKGANQALAAARAGARVALVGCVGNDPFAEAALALLRASTVDVSAVRSTAHPTGTATILVDRAGRNCIAVAAGANAATTATMLDPLDLGPGSLLVLQGELPVAETEAAILLARTRGAKVVLNLAPVIALTPTALGAVDWLIVNESESALLAARLGMPSPPSAFATAAAAELGANVVVTLGAAGALARAGGAEYVVPSPPIRAVDTTAAGDAFVGGLAAQLAEGAAPRDALHFATAAGALACTRAGAQSSLPSRDEIAAALAARATRNAESGAPGSSSPGAPSRTRKHSPPPPR